MAYFTDLTPYAYFHESAPEPTANVGWLAYSESFNVGVTSEVFIVALETLAKSPVNLCRGSHGCEWCPHARVLGNGEIRVSHNGLTFVAPVLIAHYVREHNYRPPQAFIDAVMAKVQS